MARLRQYFFVVFRLASYGESFGEEQLFRTEVRAFQDVPFEGMIADLKNWRREMQFKYFPVHTVKSFPSIIQLPDGLLIKFGSVLAGVEDD